MKERLSQNYESSDRTIQEANDRDIERSRADRTDPAPSRKRSLGGRVMKVIDINDEVMVTARDLARNPETGRVDYGRILRDGDGSVTVYNSRRLRDNVIDERKKSSRRLRRR